MQVRIALVGTHKGPWVPITGYKNPHLRILYLAPGAVVEVFAIGAGVHKFTCDGEHPIPASGWYRVSCSKPVQETMCEIIDKKVA